MTCPAPTVEATATTAYRASTMEAVTYATTVETRVTVHFPTSTIPDPRAAPITWATPVVAASIVTPAIIWPTVEAMEPRAGADEYSVHEVIRAPISVRRASVRSIRVVAVGAYRRRSDRYANRTYSDSHSYLRARNSAHREH